jgi:UDP-N-acetylglucosamine--N-acetylmuramyl-(pentapeptide) pyrophosphoryl-undecaprenol N-acetylglucosamine transferase
MKILLIGGGSGGHITPLLAVARELKALRPGIELIGVCEKSAAFAHLFDESEYIDEVRQVSAGKYRRYAGLKWYERWFDIKTLVLNVRDIYRTLMGYRQAKRLLSELKPDSLLIKGGFVAVPVGKAAAKLNIPYLTHDSDSTPGLANRLISNRAALHATGMPADLYSYPKEKIVYTGIPVSGKYKKLTSSRKATYREGLGLSGSSHVVTVTGGSQGGGQLNADVVAAVAVLMEEFPVLGVVHVAGAQKLKGVEEAYQKTLSPTQLKNVVLKGFANDLEVCTGAADVVVSRASATTLAELALQSQAVIVVPGLLSDGHQDKNAAYLAEKSAAAVVGYGDAKGLERAIRELLQSPEKRGLLSGNLHRLAKPHAARELATATLRIAEQGIRHAE